MVLISLHIGVCVATGHLETTIPTSNRDAVAFVFKHFVPLLVWAPIFTCRCEVNLLTQSSRAVVWVTALPFLVIVYAIALTSLQIAPPSLAFFDEYALFGSVLGVAILPWAAVCIL